VNLSQPSHSHTFQVSGHSHAVTTTSTSSTNTAAPSNSSGSFSLIPSSTTCLKKILFNVRPGKADVSKIKGCDYQFNELAPATTPSINVNNSTTTTDASGEPLVRGLLSLHSVCPMDWKAVGPNDFVSPSRVALPPVWQLILPPQTPAIASLALFSASTGGASANVTLNPATATVAEGRPASDIDIATDAAIPHAVTGTVSSPPATVTNGAAGSGQAHDNLPPICQSPTLLLFRVLSPPGRRPLAEASCPYTKVGACN